MPLVSAASDQVLIESLRRLRKQAAHHKAEVSRHRGLLRDTMARVTTLEAEVRQRGREPHAQRGEGAIHGH